MDQLNQENDFSQGSVIKNTVKLAVPMTLAQLVNVLYNIVDRVFIGWIPGENSLPLTGMGVTLPVITMVIAFANLFGMGGAPLCSMERGRGNLKKAEEIMGNSFMLMLLFGVGLTAVGLAVKKPMLYLLGASNQTFPYADKYLSIYLWGSLFVMVGLGMNQFINSQGFAGIGMLTVLLGAVSNILLDPVFIFVFHMGVQGAALATILSQFISAVWILRFLTGPKAILKLKAENLKLQLEYVKNIVALGLSGFTMSITNSLVQMMYNSALRQYGGDLYVGIMTVVNSVREVISLPVNGITNSAQPVMGFNYGAGQYKRVRKAIVFTTAVSVIYTTAAWIAVHGMPELFIQIFNPKGDLVKEGIPAMQIYYFGFFMMSLQFAGQAAFVALGKAKKAVFFSIFRKIVIVIPLILLLPGWFGLGTDGIFMAEPVSNFIGGIACFATMVITLWPELREAESGGRNI